MTIPPAPSRHERRRLQTRRLLIDTALKLVLERGYEAVTIQDITDRADLGRGTFYIHFKDKSDAVWAAIQEMMRGMEREAHEKMDLDMPQVEYYALRNIFRHARANRDLYRAVFGERGSALLAGRAQDLLAKIMLSDVRRMRAARRDESKVPAEMLAQMLTGLLSRTIVWWLENPGRCTAEQMAADVYRVLYRRQPPGEP